MLATGPLLRRLGEVVGNPSDDLAFHGAVPGRVFEEALLRYGKDKNQHGVKLPHWLMLRLIISLSFLRDLDIPNGAPGPDPTSTNGKQNGQMELEGLQ